jgi:hypothetical protein
MATAREILTWLRLQGMFTMRLGPDNPTATAPGRGDVPMMAGQHP